MSEGSSGTPESNIRDLRDLIPRDIVFVLHEGEYAIPGDIDNETAFEMYTLLLEDLLHEGLERNAVRAEGCEALHAAWPCEPLSLMLFERRDDAVERQRGPAHPAG